MKIKLVIQAALAAILLSSPLFALASEPEQVPCPAADFIKTYASHLDTVQFLDEQKTEKRFGVYSNDYSIFDEGSKRWWTVESDVMAPDFNTAFSNGVNNVSNIVKNTDSYAKEVMGFAYVCTYFDNSGKVTVFTVAQKNDQMNIMKKVISNLHTK